MNSINPNDSKFKTKKATSNFKRLKNVYLDTLGSKCFQLQEFTPTFSISQSLGRQNSTQSRNGQTSPQKQKESTQLSNTSTAAQPQIYHNNPSNPLHFFYSTSPNIMNSTISIKFYSAIQIRNKLPFSLKLELSSPSGYDNCNIVLDRGELNYIPIHFCTQGTVLRVEKKGDDGFYFDADSSENVIDFNGFIVAEDASKQQKGKSKNSYGKMPGIKEVASVGQYGGRMMRDIVDGVGGWVGFVNNESDTDMSGKSWKSAYQSCKGYLLGDE